MTQLVAVLAALALPVHGAVVPGRSLGGVSLGAPRAAVVARWGNAHGVCRACREPTWYFTYKPFEPQGAGVAFRHGRVAALFTLWSPPGWRTSDGLAVGDNAARVTQLYGALPRTTCAGYDALTLRRRGAVTAIYLTGETVYGFGVMTPSERVCR